MSVDLGKLGQFVQPPGFMDAVHIPVISVECVGGVDPGEWVKLSSDKTKAWACSQREADGIADPFINSDPGGEYQDGAYDGEWMYVLLRPGIAGKVTHSFSMDGFTPPDEDDEREWLKHRAPDDGCRGCY